MPSSGWDMRRALTTSDLRRAKATRDEFLLRPRRPITVVLDGVTQNYNIGAIFRLCDAFLVQELVVCGAKVELHKRKLVQAAQGTQRWVPWSEGCAFGVPQNDNGRTCARPSHSQCCYPRREPRSNRPMMHRRVAASTSSPICSR